jgi:hypothetical protein
MTRDDGLVEVCAARPLQLLNLNLTSDIYNDILNMTYILRGKFEETPDYFAPLIK